MRVDQPAQALLAATLLLLVLLPATAWGARRDPGLELRLVSRALAERGLVPHPNPLGKRIGRIHIAVQDVFTSDDPFPNWLNVVHVSTRDSVVRRELLVKEGQTVDRALLEESARNLRALNLFSMVIIVPTYSAESSDVVDLLVFAKDIWSLRLEWDFRNTGFGFDLLQGALTERNIAGLGKLGKLRFGLDRGTWRVGETYADPRLFGTRWAVVETAEVIFPRDGSGPEGLVAEAALIRPLSTTATRWGGELRARFEDRYSRRFLGADLVTWDDPLTEEVEAFDWRFHLRRISVDSIVVRSFGSELKTNLSLGYGVRDWEYAVADDMTADQERRFSEWVRLPAPEQAAYVVGRAHHYANDHRVFHDLDTFAISEDRRLGHDLDLVWRAAHPSLGFGEDWLELDLAVGYRALLWGSDLLELSAGIRSRRDEGRWINNRVTGQIRNYGPKTSWGRVVYRFGLALGWDDEQSTLVTVGGDSSLRGYLAGSRAGLCSLRQNLEYRSLALDLKTIQIGWVAFWDAGDAFDSQDQIDVRHSVGVGFRILFPQTNRMVLRGDLGVPLSGDETGFGGWFAFSFGQAF